MKVAGDSHIKGVERRRIHLQNLPMHLGTRLFLLSIRMARSFQIMTGLHGVFFFKYVSGGPRCQEMGAHTGAVRPLGVPALAGSARRAEPSLTAKSSRSWQPGRINISLPECSLRLEI